MLAVFLDFDGVLHRKMIGNFELLPNFTKLLDKYPEIMVVISSDWRHELKKTDYQSIFGKYSTRIIGVTGKHTDKKREVEILEYVRLHNIEHFIAVDDDCRNELFSQGCPWLFKTSYFKGLNDETLFRLDEFIKNRLERAYATN
jgi:hypothetical protein